MFYCKKGVYFGLKSQCFITKRGCFQLKSQCLPQKRGVIFKMVKQGWVSLFPVSEGAGSIISSLPGYSNGGVVPSQVQGMSQDMGAAILCQFQLLTISNSGPRLAIYDGATTHIS